MRTQLPPGGAGGEGGASGTPPAPTGALSQFWGTKFGFKTHTARTQTQSTGAGCVQPRADFFPTEHSLPPGDTRQEGGAPTLTASLSLGQCYSSQGAFTALRGEEQKDSETKSGAVSCPAGLGRSWRPIPPPHPLGSVSGAPNLGRAAPRGGPLHFHPFATQTDHLGCLTLHRALSQTSPRPFQPPT